MDLSQEQVRVLARLSGLDIPDDDLAEVAGRASALLTAVEQLEAELGDRLDEFEPIPPIYPHEDELDLADVLPDEG